MTSRAIIITSLCLFLITASSMTAQEILPRIVKKVEPSTVVILTFNKEGQPLSQGSGFFINKAGDLITNRHVLEQAARAEVKLTNGKTYNVREITGEDREGDLVRLKADVPLNLVHHLSLTAVLPEVGERILVIGSPQGLERTVADGIVSAVRDVLGLGKIIQISAPISPGSSGSPVVNMKGEVIGVATFQVTTGQNLNFAIPAQRVRGLAEIMERTLPEWEAIGSEDSVSAEAEYLSALHYFNIENYKEAFVRVKKVILINPDNADAHHLLGSIYSRLGHHTEAIESIKQAIRLNPDFAWAHHSLGGEYVFTGQFLAAVESEKQAIRFDPNNAEYYFWQCMIYDIQEARKTLGARRAEAIEPCEQAIRLKCKYQAKAYYLLGVSYLVSGKYGQAIDAIKEAIRLKPNYAEPSFSLGEAHYILGVAYLAIGDRSSALSEYKILKDIDKGLADQLFNAIYK